MSRWCEGRRESHCEIVRVFQENKWADSNPARRPLCSKPDQEHQPVDLRADEQGSCKIAEPEMRRATAQKIRRSRFVDRTVLASRCPAQPRQWFATAAAVRD